MSQRDHMHNPILGIDFGTTKSCIAKWDGSGPSIYTLSNGQPILPTVLYYDDKKDSFLVGTEAIQEGNRNPDNLIDKIKKSLEDSSEKIKVGNREFGPIILVKEILAELRAEAKKIVPANKFKPQGVVVTVPYYFKEQQRKNTDAAARLAGLGSIKIILEPIAAALSHLLKMKNEGGLEALDKPKKFLVFDLGGLTLDITLFELRVNRDKNLNFEVINTGGDKTIGGQYFDELIIEYIKQRENLAAPRAEGRRNRFRRETYSKRDEYYLREACIKAKESLGSARRTTAYLSAPYLFDEEGPTLEFTLQEMNELLSPALDRIKGILDDTLRNSKLTDDDIDIILKVGGSSKLKLISSYLTERFGDKIYGDDPGTSVAKGAAIYGAILEKDFDLGGQIIIKERTIHSIGVEIENGQYFPIIPSNSTLPTKHTTTFTPDVDGINSLTINFFQESLDKNSKIAVCKLSGLPKLTAGELSIEITIMVEI
ncbi:MAG: Hsp70 family protein, partial [Lewinella sp.]|nr:Hsp70 family protein [Lewinella sp.]